MYPGQLIIGTDIQHIKSSVIIIFKKKILWGLQNWIWRVAQ